MTIRIRLALSRFSKASEKTTRIRICIFAVIVTVAFLEMLKQSSMLQSVVIVTSFSTLPKTSALVVGKSSKNTGFPLFAITRPMELPPVENISHWSVELRDQLLEEMQYNIETTNLPVVKPRYVYVGDTMILSEILSNGQLVVPAKHDLALWENANLRLCSLLRYMTFTTDTSLADTSHHDDPLKLGILQLPTPILNMTFDASALQHHDHGAANWIIAIYSARISAAYSKVEFHFQTTQQNEPIWYERSLLPWFHVIQPAPSYSDPWPFDADMPFDEGDACAAYQSLRLDRMFNKIRLDLRAIAWQIVDPPPFVLDSYKNVTKMKNSNDNNIAWLIKSSSPTPPAGPLIQFPAPITRIPNVELDDVVIHFRCGDVMAGGPLARDYGLMKYAEYVKWIDAETTTSIGIATQPFNETHLRQLDTDTSEKCYQAVQLMVNYLQAKFPKATVSIRNDPDEPIPVTYARMVFAKQSFTTISTFGFLPTIATYGEGYFQESKGVYPYSTFFLEMASNLHELDASILISKTIANIGLNATLAWLVSEEAS